MYVNICIHGGNEKRLKFENIKESYIGQFGGRKRKGETV